MKLLLRIGKFVFVSLPMQQHSFKTLIITGKYHVYLIGRASINLCAMEVGVTVMLCSVTKQISVAD